MVGHGGAGLRVRGRRPYGGRKPVPEPDRRPGRPVVLRPRGRGHRAGLLRDGRLRPDAGRLRLGAGQRPRVVRPRSLHGDGVPGRRRARELRTEGLGPGGRGPRRAAAVPAVADRVPDRRRCGRGRRASAGARVRRRHARRPHAAVVAQRLCRADRRPPGRGGGQFRAGQRGAVAGGVRQLCRRRRSGRGPGGRAFSALRRSAADGRRSAARRALECRERVMGSGVGTHGCRARLLVICSLTATGVPVPIPFEKFKV